MIRKFLFVGAVLMLGTTTRLLANEAQAAEITQHIPPAYFGLHMSRIVQPQPWYPHGDKITPWPSIKFGSWRLWESYVDWPSLEPERGKWNFQTLDKYVGLGGTGWY